MDSNCAKNINNSLIKIRKLSKKVSNNNICKLSKQVSTNTEAIDILQDNEYSWFLESGTGPTGTPLSGPLEVKNKDTVRLFSTVGDIKVSEGSILVDLSGIGGGVTGSGSGTIQPSDSKTLNIRARDEGIISGNARGENSVDLQTIRANALQVASGNYSVIVGGSNNTAFGPHSFVCGSDNTASGPHSFVGGGIENTASVSGSFVCGSNNTASGQYSFVGGGIVNTASELSSFVGGGSFNFASGKNSVVIGGGSNNAYGQNSVVVGGSSNSAFEIGSVVGGSSNNASGQNSFVGGGSNNTSSGSSSYAAGKFANANATGAFVWADSSNASNWPVTATSNSFNVKATGGLNVEVPPITTTSSGATGFLDIMVNGNPYKIQLYLP